MSRHNPQAVYREQGRELVELLNAVLAGDLSGELVTDRVEVERQVVRALGALVRLHKRHRVDERGQCWFCWLAPRWGRPWPKRTTCTVHNALGFYLRQPEWFMLSVIAEHDAAVGGRS